LKELLACKKWCLNVERNLAEHYCPTFPNVARYSWLVAYYITEPLNTDYLEKESQ